MVVEPSVVARRTMCVNRSLSEFMVFEGVCRVVSSGVGGLLPLYAMGVPVISVL